jgi:hypothetical protein
VRDPMSRSTVNSVENLHLSNVSDEATPSFFRHTAIAIAIAIAIAAAGSTADFYILLQLGEQSSEGHKRHGLQPFPVRRLFVDNVVV